MEKVLGNLAAVLLGDNLRGGRETKQGIALQETGMPGRRNVNPMLKRDSRLTMSDRRRWKAGAGGHDGWEFGGALREGEKTLAI
jgi:hypothetical protein